MLIQEQQFSNLKKEAKCKFSLAEYARRRHSNERIAKSGIGNEVLERPKKKN